MNRNDMIKEIVESIDSLTYLAEIVIKHMNLLPSTANPEEKLLVICLVKESIVKHFTNGFNEKLGTDKQVKKIYKYVKNDLYNTFGVALKEISSNFDMSKTAFSAVLDNRFPNKIREKLLSEFVDIINNNNLNITPIDPDKGPDGNLLN